MQYSRTTEGGHWPYLVGPSSIFLGGTEKLIARGSSLEEERSSPCFICLVVVDVVAVNTMLVLTSISGRSVNLSCFMVF